MIDLDIKKKIANINKVFPEIKKYENKSKRIY